MTTETFHAKRPVLPIKLLLLNQKDDSQAVLTNFADEVGLKYPKFIPFAEIYTAPDKGRETTVEEMLLTRVLVYEKTSMKRVV